MKPYKSVAAMFCVALCILAFSQYSRAQSAGGAPGVFRQPFPRTCIKDGDVAYNRGPSMLPSPVPYDFNLLRGCGPFPFVSGWTPLPWPKYDAYRDVVFLSKEHPSGGYRLYTADCSGAVILFDPPGLPGYLSEAVAPVGDGRVYLLSTVLYFIDANDVPHQVFDPTGVAFQWPAVQASDMVYDRASDSLIVLQSTAGTGGPCSPPGIANATVTKIPLNTAGDQLTGPVSRYTFCAGTHSTSVPRIARHVDGRLLFRVATENVPNVTVEWLDTSSMTTFWFCTEQDSPGNAYQIIHGRNVSAYSSGLGGVLDVTQNVPCGPGCTPTATLRLYTEGSIGPGIPLCSWQNEYRSLFVDFVK